MSTVILLTLLGFFLARAHSVQRYVEVLEAGLFPLIRDHIGIHFFVTVSNRGPDPTEVEVTMLQCCETFPGGHNDCSYFDLIPETRIMEPNMSRNFTLIHPTLYPHNRRGECLLGVHYITSSNHSRDIRQYISFDTTLTENNVKCNIFNGFQTNSITRQCRSHDEDALDGCKMVDCHKKYFGLKSYFNKASRVCEPVPACIPSKRRGTPNIVYDVTTNQCSDLSGYLSEEDLQHLSHGDLESECAPYYSGKMPFVNCHHGDLSNVTGDCVCDRNYRLAVMPEEPGNPRTQVFHSCNVASCWSWGRFFTFPELRILIFAIILSLIVFLMTLFIVHDN